MPGSMPSLLPLSVSRWGIGAVGSALVVAHNLFDHSARPEAFGALGPVFAVYPLMPWIGLLALGYALGRRRSIGG